MLTVLAHAIGNLHMHSEPSVGVVIVVLAFAAAVVVCLTGRGSR